MLFRSIQSKRQLPFQQHAEYDRVLAERTTQALNEGTMKKEELVGGQHKIDANKNNKIDAQDFKILKAKKGQMNEDDMEKFEPDDKEKSEKKHKTYTFRHKTSGKEVVLTTKTHKNPDEWKLVSEAKYSAKAARAGEDIGKPGKNFEKIAQKAGEKYGSEERGKKVEIGRAHV